MLEETQQQMQDTVNKSDNDPKEANVHLTAEGADTAAASGRSRIGAAGFFKHMTRLKHRSACGAAYVAGIAVPCQVGGHRTNQHLQAHMVVHVYAACFCAQCFAAGTPGNHIIRGNAGCDTGFHRLIETVILLICNRAAFTFHPVSGGIVLGRNKAMRNRFRCRATGTYGPVINLIISDRVVDVHARGGNFRAHI